MPGARASSPALSAKREKLWAPFFLELARAAHAFADEGVRAPSVEPPFLTLD